LRRALELTSADVCSRRRGRGGCPCGGRISSTVAPSPASPATTSSPGREILPRAPPRRRGRGASPWRADPAHRRAVSRISSGHLLVWSHHPTRLRHGLRHGRTRRQRLQSLGAPAPWSSAGGGSGARQGAEVELDGWRRWSFASIPLLPWDDARAQRQVGRVCSEERESQECACPGRLPQNAAPDAVTTEGATVDSHSSFSRCGAGCSNR
jgi:hypothetical protein